MNRPVAVVDIKVVEPAHYWSLGWSDLAREAAADLIGGPSIEGIICAVSAGAGANQADPAAIVADRLGLIGVTTLAVDCGQASAGAAINLAATLIAHGVFKDLLVVGAAKASDLGEAERLALFDRSLDQQTELSKGLDFTAQAGLLADLRLQRADSEPGLFARATMANRNAWAHRHGQRQSSLRETQFDLVVAPPLLRGDFPQILDGAAAVRLRPTSSAGRLSITAVAASNDIVSPFDRPDALDLRAVLKVLKALAGTASPPSFIDFDVACSLVDVLAQDAANSLGSGGPQAWRFNPTGGAQGRGHVDGQGALFQLFDLFHGDLEATTGLALSVSGLGGQVHGRRLTLGDRR